MSVDDLDVFCINLPERVDRRQHMDSTLKSLNIHHVTFVAPVQPPHGRDAELSLVLTVASILQDAKRRHLRWVLIFEDDVIMRERPEAVRDRLQAALVTLTTRMDDWDMLYLEYCMEWCWGDRVAIDELVQGRRPLCTAAIVYNGRAIDRVLSCIEERRQADLDGAYAACAQSGRLRVYLMQPPLFFQDKMYASDIQVGQAARLRHLFLERAGIAALVLAVSIVTLVALCTVMLFLYAAGR